MHFVKQEACDGLVHPVGVMFHGVHAVKVVSLQGKISEFVFKQFVDQRKMRPVFLLPGNTQCFVKNQCRNEKVVAGGNFFFVDENRAAFGIGGRRGFADRRGVFFRLCPIPFAFSEKPQPDLGLIIRLRIFS